MCATTLALKEVIAIPSTARDAASAHPGEAPAPGIAVLCVSMDIPIGGWAFDPESGEWIGRGQTLADAVASLVAARLVAVLKEQHQDKIVKEVVARILDGIEREIGPVVAGIVDTIRDELR